MLKARPQKHIENMIVAAEGLLHEDSNDPLKRANAVAGLLDSYFDFPAITRFSAGPYWRAATEAENANMSKRYGRLSSARW